MRKVAVIAAAVVLQVVLAAGLLAAVEYRYHRPGREAMFGYVNIYGYRGEAVSRKRPGEFRVVVVGGSTVYGQGTDAAGTIPAALERALRQSGRDITVVNLGYMNDGAYADGLTLADYRRLNYDLAILYEGYNDLFNVPNLYSFRHHSAVFRLTGYLPLFPVVFEEKAKALRYGGDISAGYRGGRPAFSAGVAARTGAAALKFAAGLDQRMSAAAQDAESRSTGGACGYWTFFCEHVAANVRTALAAGADTLVVVQPYLPAPSERPGDGPVKAVLHREQAAKTLAYLREQFPREGRLHVADLGELIDLREPHYRFDTVHLTEEGNAVVAGRLVDPVLQVAGQRTARAANGSGLP
jgi:hypothetical protein